MAIFCTLPLVFLSFLDFESIDFELSSEFSPDFLIQFCRHTWKISRIRKIIWISFLKWSNITYFSFLYCTFELTRWSIDLFLQVLLKFQWKILFAFEKIFFLIVAEPLSIGCYRKVNTSVIMYNNIYKFIYLKQIHWLSRSNLYVQGKERTILKKTY